jgi:hypothetical protein
VLKRVKSSGGEGIKHAKSQGGGAPPQKWAPLPAGGVEGTPWGSIMCISAWNTIQENAGLPEMGGAALVSVTNAH